MSKTTARKTQKTSPETAAAALAVPPLHGFIEEYGSPERLAMLLDEIETREDSPFWKSYDELRALFLDESGPESNKLLNVFEQVDDFWRVEEPIRRAGFVMGFTTAVRLLTGQTIARMTDEGQ